MKHEKLGEGKKQVHTPLKRTVLLWWRVGRVVIYDSLNPEVGHARS